MDEALAEAPAPLLVFKAAKTRGSALAEQRADDARRADPGEKGAPPCDCRPADDEAEAVAEDEGRDPHTVYEVGQWITGHKVGPNGFAVKVSGEIEAVGPKGVRLGPGKKDPHGQKHELSWEELGAPKVKDKPIARTGKASARPKPKSVAKAFLAFALDPFGHGDLAQGEVAKGDVTGYWRTDRATGKREWVPEHRDHRGDHAEAPAHAGNPAHAAPKHAGAALVGQFNAAARAAGKPWRLHPAKDAGTFKIGVAGADGEVHYRVVSVEEAHRLLAGLGHKGGDRHAAHRAVAEEKERHAYGDTRKAVIAGPVVVFKGDAAPPSGPDDGFGALPGGLPLVVFAMAAGAQAAEPPPAPAAEPDFAATDPGDRPVVEGAAEEEAPPLADPRGTYFGRALSALRNFWAPKE